MELRKRLVTLAEQILAKAKPGCDAENILIGALMEFEALREELAPHLLKPAEDKAEEERPNRRLAAARKFAEGLTQEGSWIYAVSNGEAIKIGLANDPKRRLGTLQIGSLDRLEIVHLAGPSPNAVQWERIVHHRLAPKRLNGEWFAVTPEEARIAIDQAVPILDATSQSLPA